MGPSDEVSCAYVIQTPEGRTRPLLSEHLYVHEQWDFMAEPSLPAKCLRMLFHEVENNISKFYLKRVFKDEKCKNA